MSILITSKSASPTSNRLYSSSDAINYAFAFSVGSNALTIALKDVNGNDPSIASPVIVGFRNSSAGSGLFSARTATAAKSFVISSGSTLGAANGEAFTVFIYFIDTGSGFDIGVSRQALAEGVLRGVTAEGGAGGADANNVLYGPSTLGASPVRLVGMFRISLTTAGAWSVVPTNAYLLPFTAPTNVLRVGGTTTSCPNATSTSIVFNTRTYDPFNMYNTTNGRATPILAGNYYCYWQGNFNYAANAIGNGWQASFSINGVTVEQNIQGWSAETTTTCARVAIAQGRMSLGTSDYINTDFYHGMAGGGVTFVNNAQYSYFEMWYMGPIV